MRSRTTTALPRTLRLTIVALVVLVAALLAHLVVTVVTPASRIAGAAGFVVTPGVSTDPGGATVTIDARGTWREGGGTSASGTGCRRVWVPAVAPVYLDRGGTMWNGRHPMPSKPAPDAVAYHVYCGGTYVTSVWLRPSAFLPAPDTSREIALRLVARLPYPALGITVNPATRGLAGLDSYLATTGYSSTITDRVAGFGATVEVEAVPTAVTWDPGDGTGTVRVGFAPRTRGLLAHRYERRSAGYSITATLDLALRWRTAGGAWQRLPGITRRAATRYPVIAARSVLVPAP
ncbi:MAG: hypothetical protein ACKO2C_06410 [Actinomycetes bacterium]